MDAIVFWIAAGVAVVTAVNLIIQAKPINSVLSLVVVLFALAVIYLQLSAEFIAALQIIIYAGAIMVLFLFVVMLLNLKQSDGGGRLGVLRSFGLMLGGAILLEISIVVRLFVPSAIHPSAQRITGDFGSAAQIGRMLFDDYLLPFELTSILLLITVAGALILTADHREEQK